MTNVNKMTVADINAAVVFYTERYRTIIGEHKTYKDYACAVGDLNEHMKTFFGENVFEQIDISKIKDSLASMMSPELAKSICEYNTKFKWGVCTLGAVAVVGIGVGIYKLFSK